MKHYLSIILTAATLFLLSSCQKMSYQGHSLDEAKKIENIAITDGNLVRQGHKDGGVAFFMISFVPRLCEPGEYEEMWSYYNDNGYYGNKQSGVSEIDRIHYTGSYHISDCRFTSIDITALTEFNSDHPANSKLNGICWYSFPVSRVGGMNSGRIEGSVPTPVDCSIRIGRLDNIAPDDMSLFNA